MTFLRFCSLSLFISSLAFAAEISQISFSGLSYTPLTPLRYPQQGWMASFDFSIEQSVLTGDFFELSMNHVYRLKFDNDDSTMIAKLNDGTKAFQCFPKQQAAYLYEDTIFRCEATTGLPSAVSGSISFSLSFNNGGSKYQYELQNAQVFHAGANQVHLSDKMSASVNFDAYDFKDDIYTIGRTTTYNNFETYYLAMKCPDGYLLGGTQTINYDNLGKILALDCSSAQVFLSENFNDWSLPLDYEIAAADVSCSGNTLKVDLNETEPKKMLWINALQSVAPGINTIQHDVRLKYSCSNTLQKTIQTKDLHTVVEYTIYQGTADATLSRSSSVPEATSTRSCSRCTVSSSAASSQTTHSCSKCSGSLISSSSVTGTSSEPSSSATSRSSSSLSISTIQSTTSCTECRLSTATSSSSSASSSSITPSSSGSTSSSSSITPSSSGSTSSSSSITPSSSTEITSSGPSSSSNETTSSGSSTSSTPFLTTSTTSTISSVKSSSISGSTTSPSFSSSSSNANSSSSTPSSVESTTSNITIPSSSTTSPSTNLSSSVFSGTSSSTSDVSSVLSTTLSTSSSVSSAPSESSSSILPSFTTSSTSVPSQVTSPSDCSPTPITSDSCSLSSDSSCTTSSNAETLITRGTTKCSHCVTTSISTSNLEQHTTNSTVPCFTCLTLSSSKDSIISQLGTCTTCPGSFSENSAYLTRTTTNVASTTTPVDQTQLEGSSFRFSLFSLAEPSSVSSTDETFTNQTLGTGTTSMESGTITVVTSLVTDVPSKSSIRPVSLQPTPLTPESSLSVYEGAAFTRGKGAHSSAFFALLLLMLL